MKVVSAICKWIAAMTSGMYIDSAKRGHGYPVITSTNLCCCHMSTARNLRIQVLRMQRNRQYNTLSVSWSTATNDRSIQAWPQVLFCRASRGLQNVRERHTQPPIARDF